MARWWWIVIAAVVAAELALLLYWRHLLADANREFLYLCEVQSGLATCRREHWEGGCERLILPACRAYLGPVWATGAR